MFLDFLIHLRNGNFKVSLNEWLNLVDGMRMGLHGQSVHGFYILCRALLVKTETDLDKFEELFYQFFKDVSSHQLLQEMEEFLHHPEIVEQLLAGYMDSKDMSADRLKAALNSRLAASDGISSLGEGIPTSSAGESVSVGSAGGNGDGASPGNGAAVQGAGGKSIVHTQGSRKFRDWRTDSTIESRQFQMAFRLLRELSRKLNTSEEELDIYGTINNTCKRGGILDITMQPPRRNKLKVMVLIDSGGSMRPFEELCSLLFQSLNKANTFTDLKIYYFHNCLESEVYLDPSIDTDKTIKTDWILRNISDDYRVIFVGDADMALHELVGSSYGSHVDGITWFRRFSDKYNHCVWLHPQEREENIMWMGESFIEIEKVFPMYRLSIDGLKDAMYKLMRGN